MTNAEFNALPVADQLRFETLAMMTQDGDLTEHDANDILNQAQMDMF
jgi:hypothetical protein